MEKNMEIISLFGKPTAMITPNLAKKLYVSMLWVQKLYRKYEQIKSNDIFREKKNILELSRVYFRSSLIWIFTYNMLHQTFQKKNVNKPFDNITTFKKKKLLENQKDKETSIA